MTLQLQVNYIIITVNKLSVSVFVSVAINAQRSLCCLVSRAYMEKTYVSTTSSRNHEMLTVWWRYVIIVFLRFICVLNHVGLNEYNCM